MMRHVGNASRIGPFVPPPPSRGFIRGIDAWLPTVATGVVAFGAITALAGTVSGDRRLLLVGGGAAATGLLVLMAGQWIDPLAALILALPLPALYADGAMRIAPAAPVTALLVAAWFLGWPARDGSIRTARLPTLHLLLLMVALVLAGLVSQYRGLALREIANLGLLFLLLAVATDLIARKPKRVSALVAAIVGVASVTGALAVLESLMILPGRFPQPGGFNRAALGFGQPNGLGMFLALSIPFAVYVRRVSRGRAERIAATLALAAMAAGLFATLSRGSWLSVLAGAGLLPLAGRWRFTLRIWGGALLLGVLGDIVTGGVIREAVFALPRDWSVAQRAALMLAGIQIFLQAPVLGVGPGGFAPELERIGAVVPQVWDLQLTPHNAYIQMAAETGLVGLAAFVALLLALVWRALRLARSPAEPSRRALHVAVLWALGISLAEGFVEWPFSHGQGQLVMLIAALACSLPITDGEGDEAAAAAARVRHLAERRRP